MKIFYNVGSIKALAKLLKDFEQTVNLTFSDFIGQQADFLSDFSEDVAEWMVSTFMGIQRYKTILDVALNPDYHRRMIKPLAMIYAQIMTYGLLFEIPIEEKENIYKLLLNLNSEMAHVLFFKHLTAPENISMTASVSCQLFEPQFVNEDITMPLLKWRPVLEEMRQTYELYLEKLEEDRRPPVTKAVSIELRTCSRKKPESHEKETEEVVVEVEPKLKKPVKMLTKAKIDENLARKFRENRERAENLYVEANIIDKNYLKIKSSKYYDTLEKIHQELDSQIQPQKPHAKVLQFPEVKVKENKALVKRIQNTINVIHDEEVKFIGDITEGCRNTLKVKELIEAEKNDNEAAEELTKEKKHILAQMAYEKAILAREQLKDVNKKKYLETIEEKIRWEKLLKQIKHEDELKKKQILEKLSFYELQLTDAKNGLVQAKKNAVDEIKRSKILVWQNEMEKRQKDFEERVRMIKELRALENLRREAKLPKVVDFTQPVGFGFINEMSLAELAERLMEMKIDYLTKLEEKKQHIKDSREKVQKIYKLEVNMIKEHLLDRREMRNIDKEKNKKKKDIIEKVTSPENEKLKQLLAAKRQERKRLTGNKASKK